MTSAWAEPGIVQREPSGGGPDGGGGGGGRVEPESGGQPGAGPDPPERTKTTQMVKPNPVPAGRTQLP